MSKASTKWEDFDLQTSIQPRARRLLLSSSLYEDFLAERRAVRLREARHSPALSPKERICMVVELTQGLDPSNAEHSITLDSKGFALALCIQDVTVQEKAALLREETRAIEYLRHWTALIPAYMYVAQCFHNSEMSCLEDFDLNAGLVAESLLAFNFDEIQITQDQARAWLKIVQAMKAIGDLMHAVDQFLLLKQVLCCIFGEAHKGLVYIPCLDDDHLEDRKVHLLQLGSAVGKALCGKMWLPSSTCSGS